MSAAALNGLSEDEAGRRLGQVGPNAIPTAGRRTLWSIGWEALREPMFLLLVGATAVYLLIGDLGEGLFLAAGASATGVGVSVGTGTVGVTGVGAGGAVGTGLGSGGRVGCVRGIVADGTGDGVGSTELAPHPVKAPARSTAQPSNNALADLPISSVLSLYHNTKNG